MTNATEQLIVFTTSYGLKIIGAIITLILGRVAAGLGRKVVNNLLEKARTDPSIISFVSRLTYILILIFSLIAALAKFGIQTTSFVAVLGAAGLAVGLALQGSLSNFAAGVLILVLRPFKIGDYIDGAGEAGTVKEISLFNTILATPDNVKIIIPNGKLFGDTIKNISAYDDRRLDLTVGIGYSSDIHRAFDLLHALLKADPRVLDDPTAQIAVSELADSSVNLIVRPWVKKENYWQLKLDLTLKIKETFEENGIELPFPQRAVHIVSKSS
ncbi:MAG: mechanosensitive ion channel family protein [Desulfobacterales bacterium]